MSSARLFGTVSPKTSEKKTACWRWPLDVECLLKASLRRLNSVLLTVKLYGSCVSLLNMYMNSVSSVIGFNKDLPRLTASSYVRTCPSSLESLAPMTKPRKRVTWKCDSLTFGVLLKEPSHHSFFTAGAVAAAVIDDNNNLSFSRHRSSMDHTFDISLLLLLLLFIPLSARSSRKMKPLPTTHSGPVTMLTTVTELIL